MIDRADPDHTCDRFCCAYCRIAALESECDVCFGSHYNLHGDTVVATSPSGSDPSDRKSPSD